MNILNKKCIILCSALSINAFAGEQGDRYKLTPEQEYEYFIKNGLPVPGTGVHVMPSTAMVGMPEKHLRNNLLSIKNHGYIKTKNDNGVELLNIKNLSASDVENSCNDLDPKSTHMKRNATAIHSGFGFIGAPVDITREVIGFSPMGAYIDGKGWTGGIEFFYPSNFPSDMVCSFSQSNLKLTGGSANLAEEIVSYDVNKKVTVAYVEGSDDTAFSYSVEWYDDSYRNEILCAEKKFNKDRLGDVLKLAVKIDNSIV